MPRNRGHAEDRISLDPPRISGAVLSRSAPVPALFTFLLCHAACLRLIPELSDHPRS